MFTSKLKLIAMGLLAAVGLAIGAGALAQQASKDQPPDAPRPEAGAQPPAKKARGSEGDHRWVKTLANGATLEVIGISPHPSGPTSWWGPDGTPLAQPPSDSSPTRMSSDQNVVPRAVVVRMTGMPLDADSFWTINEKVGGGSNGSAWRAGKEVPGLKEWITEFPPDLATCTIQFKVAAGPWQTVRTSDGQHSFGHASRIGPSTVFGKAVATKEGTALSVAHDIQDVAVRLVAVDRLGEECQAIEWSGGGVNGFHLLAAEFDLRPEEIKEYRLQTRPYEQGEIKGVALRPAR